MVVRDRVVVGFASNRIENEVCQITANGCFHNVVYSKFQVTDI